MAKAKGGSGKEKKGKKPHKNKPTGKKYSYYKIEGEKAERQKKFCVKCGPGVFLAKHGNRAYCGRCHYTEFDGKKE